ncbi:MAG TPA: hypothetical protein VFM69_06465 [Pricia sp.]|nr:hypothetical protein [Pricia sp.]
MAKSNNTGKTTSTIRWEDGVYEKLQELCAHYSNSQNGVINFCIKEYHSKIFKGDR